MSVVHMILLIDPQCQVGRVMFFCNYVINAFNFDGEASFFALQLFFFKKTPPLLQRFTALPFDHLLH